jgi:hypothetical protein
MRACSDSSAATIPGDVGHPSTTPASLCPLAPLLDSKIRTNLAQNMSCSMVWLEERSRGSESVTTDVLRAHPVTITPGNIIDRPDRERPDDWPDKYAS